MRRTSALDDLIDRYLLAEARDRPPLGYPTRASGTALARPTRQWQSTHETLDESTNYAELQACEGAWDSLERTDDRALRVDAMNRKLNATVFRVPGTSAIGTAALVDRAKRRLTRLLSDRGVFV